MEKNKIYLAKPMVSQSVNQHVLNALNSGWISSAGPYLDKFENEIKTYTKSEFVYALNSGSSALHLAMKAIGIKEGDQVIVPSYSFVASAMPLKYLKAIPVFIDVDENGNISLEQLKIYLENTKIKPKAVILVHSYGIAVDVAKFKSILDEFEIPIIEDAAEALGTFINQKHVGTIGDIGILSFNGNKVITSSAGGAILTNNENYYTKIKKWANQSKVNDKEHYYHDEIGYNYRMSNICAAIGFGQLEMIEDLLKKKKEIYLEYKSYLGAHFNFLNSLAENETNHWLTVIELKSEEQKKEVLSFLSQHNIETRNTWFPLHKMPVFKNHIANEMNKTNQLFEKCLCLPSATNISKKEIKYISNLILEKRNLI